MVLGLLINILYKNFGWSKTNKVIQFDPKTSDQSKLIILEPLVIQMAGIELRKVGQWKFGVSPKYPCQASEDINCKFISSEN